MHNYFCLFFSSLLSAILYFTLHCHLMKDADNLINLYEPMLKNLCKPKVRGMNDGYIDSENLIECT